MIAAPINPSDVIPITGAYAHRVQPPLVAGYEGLGRVVATSDALPFSLGQHVLPLRGDGTWQQRLNCTGQWLVPVPEDIADDIALRGYINPLAARLMLRRWPVRDQQIILTAAGSDCARLLGQWALAGGARRVIGLHRAPQHAPRLRRRGIQPLAMHCEGEILRLAAQSSLVFDAVGDRLGGALLAALRPCATLISYGLLSGQPLPRDARRREGAAIPSARRPGRHVGCRLAGGIRGALAFIAPHAAVAAGPLPTQPLARGADAFLPIRPRRQTAAVVKLVPRAQRRAECSRNLNALTTPLSAAARRPAG